MNAQQNYLKALHMYNLPIRTVFPLGKSPSYAFGQYHWFFTETEEEEEEEEEDLHLYDHLDLGYIQYSEELFTEWKEKYNIKHTSRMGDDVTIAKNNLKEAYDVVFDTMEMYWRHKRIREPLF